MSVPVWDDGGHLVCSAAMTTEREKNEQPRRQLSSAYQNQAPPTKGEKGEEREERREERSVFELFHCC